MSKKDKSILSMALFLIGVFVAYDVWSDYTAGSNIYHLTFESIIILFSFFASVWIWRQNISLKGDIARTQDELAKSKIESEKWKSENQSLIHGLSQAIDRQLNEWHFSPAEKEVALLLLKGLSFKEICVIRECSEKTVRHHAAKIYEKSNLSGRAELSAFFLEDLLNF